MVLSAVVFYAVVLTYLAMRGVPLRSVLLVAVAGLFGGVLLAFTLGMMYYVIVLLRPAETISVFAMASLLLTASYFARDQILGSITPLGIIFLNIAANFARAEGPLPLSLGWLARLIPAAPGPLRLGLSLLILYSPALLALAALRKGPPGHPLVRLLLGLWVCWVGIAAFAGPGWKALSQFDFARPTQWLVSVAAAYAAVHVMMLALNFVFAVTDRSDDMARSIAHSVTIDDMPLRNALLLGAAFWVGVYLFMRVPVPEPDKTILLIAAAFGLGALLEARASRREPGEGAIGVKPGAEPDAEAPRFSFALFRMSLLYLVVLGPLAVLAWRQQASRQGAWSSGEPFTQGDRYVEIFLLLCGGISLMIIVLTACALYEGVTRYRARRWAVVAAALAVFGAYRGIATPLSPLWQPSAADAAAPKQLHQFLVNYPDPEKRDALKARLTEAGLPFSIIAAAEEGAEILQFADEDREAVFRIISEIGHHGADSSS
jgi:heme/copper-type cytochrome/quinol oxidase subunit 2